MYMYEVVLFLWPLKLENLVLVLLGFFFFISGGLKVVNKKCPLNYKYMYLCFQSNPVHRQQHHETLCVLWPAAACGRTI